MEWLKQLNAAINYIEEHLADTIDMKAELFLQFAHVWTENPMDC